MPNPFEGLDLSEAPVTPPTGNPFAGLDLSPAEDPADRASARKLRDTLASIDSTALRTGEPILSPRGDFAPHTFSRGSRNFLSEWSKGLLDLPDTTFTPQQEDTAAGLAVSDLFASRPNLARLVADKPDLQKPLLSHVRALVRLRDTPASPRELLDASDSATSDWARAAEGGTLTDVLGNPVPLPNLRAALPLARDLYAKLHAVPFGDRYPLTPEERTAFDALGGDKWLRFVSDHKNFYIGRSRRDRLLGRPEPQGDTPPTISTFGKSSIPTDTPVAFEDLERVSTFAQGLLTEAQQAGIAQAQALDDYRDSLGSRLVGRVLGPSLASGIVGFTGATGETDDQGFFSKIGRRATHLTTNTFGAAVQGANEVVAPAINFLTLGSLNGILEGATATQRGLTGVGTGLYSFTENLLQGKYDASMDPDFLNRKTQQTVAMIGRSLALGAPEGHDDRRAADELEFIESAFPDMDEDSKRELRQSYFGGSQAVTGFMRRAAEGAAGAPLQWFSKVFRTDSPYLQRVAGENLGPLLETPEGIAFSLLGAQQLYSAVFRRSNLKKFHDPKRRDAFINLDDAAAEAGHFTQAPAALRAKVLDEINNTVSNIRDATAAGEFVSRVNRAFVDHGAPITPGLKAKIDTAADRFSKAAADLQDRTFSEADKAALLDLAEPIADLPLIDQQFIIRGKDAFVNTEGSALKVARAKRAYEEQARSVEELDFPRQMDRSPEKVAEIKAGLIEHVERERDFLQRKDRLLSVTNTLVTDLAAKAQEFHKSTYTYGALRNAAVDNFNKWLAGTVRKNVEIEDTGATFSRANPRIREPVFERLTTAVLDGGKKLDALLTDRDLATPLRASLLERLKDATDRESAIREWARNEIRDRSAPILSERVPPTEKSTAVAESIEKALQNAEVSGESVVLTPAQKKWLDEHARARGEKPFKHFKAAYDDALSRDIADAHRKADEAIALAQAIRKIQVQAEHATVDSPRIKIPKKLRKQITEALEEFDIPLEKKYVPLSTDASSLEISALEAFKESIDDLSSQHAALKAGVQKLASFEMAAMGKSMPHIVRHELNWADRAAEGALHWNRYIGKKLDRLLGRQVKKAERQRIFAEMKSGKPTTNEAAILMQDQRLRLLGEALKAQVMTPAEYADMVGTPYAHNLFDRRTQSEVADAFETRRRGTPPGYRPLAVDPGALKFRIPENGNEYVVWRDDSGKLHSKDGFETYEDALRWAGENIPAGREIAFAKTWPLVEKALSGLVEDAGISHLDMVESMTLAIHNARIGRNLASTPYVKRASDVADLVSRGEGQLSPSGSVFETADGKKFYRRDDIKNPWLEGKYVSGEAIKWLQEYKQGYGFFKEATAAAQEAMPVRGDLMGPQWKVLDTLIKGGVGGLKIANNLFPIKNIAVSASTIVKNWMSNFIFNARFAGVNFLNPIEFAYGLKDAIDGYSAYKNPELDDAWRDLAEADLVRFGNEADYYRDGPGAAHSRAVEESLNKNWRTLEPLLERKKRLEERLYSGVYRTDEALENAELELMELDNEIHAASRLAARSGFKAFFDRGIRLTGDLYDGLVHGKGKLHNALWNNWYSEVTGDRMVKYMTYKALLRKGLSKEAALHRVADFHQQLHRVPASVRQIGRTVGGAMFTSFPVDQARIFGNVIRQDPSAFLRLMLLLSGWNTVSIAASGNSPEDYLESWALQHGVTRDGISDAQALMSNVLIPGGLGVTEEPGGLYGLSLGPGLWETFKPQSRVGRSLASLMKGESTNAGTNLASDAFWGTLSKLFGADLYTMLATGVAEKVDERGDPMKDMGDIGAWLARTLAIPRGAPGSREYGVLSRALSGEEVNLHSGRQVSFGQAFTELFLQIRPELDSPSRFRAALMTEIRAHKGGLTAFKRAEAQDDQLATLLARGATNADGSINVEKARPIIKQYHLDNPTHYIRPDGVKVAGSYDEEDISRALDEYGKPKTLRTFGRQPLALQVSTYALWRAADSLAPQRDQKWYTDVRQMLLQKVTGPRRYSPTEVRDINVRIEEALNSGRLPDDAAHDLRTIQVLLSKRVSRS